MKRTIFSLLLLFSIHSLFALSFTLNGINYTTTDNNTASVTNGKSYAGNGNLPSIINFAGTNYRVTAIENGAFYNNSIITNIVIPDSVTSIGQYAFTGCSSLLSISIPGSVKLIDSYAFSNCSGDVAVDSSNPNYLSENGILYNKNKTTLIHCPTSTSGDFIVPGTVINVESYAFSGSSHLTGITILGSVQTIGSHAFSGCSGLTNISIPNSVSSIGSYAFSDCSSLPDIIIPGSVTTIEEGTFWASGISSITIPASVSSIGSFSFFSCNNLQNINIPGSVTTIANNAFSSCSELKIITIPGSVTSIENYVFSDCVSLSKITIPNSVRAIGSYSFSNCSNLNSISIPGSVTSIGRYAFSNCSALSSIYEYSSSPIPLDLNDSIFNNIDKGGCILYVPNGAKANYQTAPEWDGFTNIIEFNPLNIETPQASTDGIFYNPIDGTLRMIGLDGFAPVYLYDINGNLILKASISNETTLTTNFLPKGVYVVKIISGINVFTKKVTVI